MATSPKYGWRLPDLGDVADGPAAFSALAVDAENTIADKTVPTYTPTWTAAGTSQPTNPQSRGGWYRVQNGICDFAAQILFSSSTTGGTGDLDSRIHDAKQGLLNLRADVYGPPARQEPGERVAPTVGSRLSVLDIGLVTSTYGPTQTHKEQLQIVNEHLAGFESTLSVINESLTGIRIALRDAGVLFVE